MGSDCFNNSSRVVGFGTVVADIGANCAVDGFIVGTNSESPSLLPVGLCNIPPSCHFLKREENESSPVDSRTDSDRVARS